MSRKNGGSKKKGILTIICFALTLSFAKAEETSVPAQKISSTCEWIRKMGKLPEHYCYCEEERSTFTLPFDTQITKPVWYMATLGQVKSGLTAYLYGDCEVGLEIYKLCASSKPTYYFDLCPNQTRDIDGQAIQAQIESTGIGEIVTDETPLYFYIYPIDGKGGRVICMPYNEGYHSTCDDCLAIIPKMVIVSSHSEDVYFLDTTNIPLEKGLAVRWTEPDSTLCHLRITYGDCDGEVVAEADLQVGDQLYYLDKKLLETAREEGKQLYFHFTHEAPVGRIVLERYSYTPTSITDIQKNVPAKILIENGRIFIQKGQLRYDLLGNIVHS